jgi:hypothetical protein
MIIYNVTISIEKDIEEEWLNWMREVHIPEVLKTGLFLRHNIYKVIPIEIKENTYCIQYTCESMNEYDQYQKKFAGKLQKDHSDRYQNKFVAFRTLLEML